MNNALNRINVAWSFFQRMKKAEEEQNRREYEEFLIATVLTARSVGWILSSLYGKKEGYRNFADEFRSNHHEIYSYFTTKRNHMEKRGIVPDPSKVLIVNLKTREVKIFNFGKNE